MLIADEEDKFAIGLSKSNVSSEARNAEQELEEEFYGKDQALARKEG